MLEEEQGMEMSKTNLASIKRHISVALNYLQCCKQEFQFKNTSM